jgi:hypothetical protein
MPTEDALFRPYSRLLKIVVLGRTIEVPENNPLLRGFQHNCPETVPYGKFCWNNECGNSKFYYRLPGDPVEHKSRACQFIPVEGMQITVLSAELKWVLRKLLQRPPDQQLEPKGVDADAEEDDSHDADR